MKVGKNTLVFATVVVLIAVVLVAAAVLPMVQETYPSFPVKVYRPVYGSIYCGEGPSATRVNDYKTENLVISQKVATVSHLCLGSHCSVGSLQGATCGFDWLGQPKKRLIAISVDGRQPTVVEHWSQAEGMETGQGGQITINIGCFDTTTYYVCTLSSYLVGGVTAQFLIEPYCRDFSSSPASGYVTFDYDTPLKLMGWKDGAPFALRGGKDCLASDNKLTDIKNQNNFEDVDSDLELKNTWYEPTKLCNGKSCIIPEDADHYLERVFTKTNPVSGKTYTYVAAGYYKPFLVGWTEADFGAELGEYNGDIVWCSMAEGNMLYKVELRNGKYIATSKIKRVQCCPGSCTGNKYCDKRDWVCKTHDEVEYDCPSGSDAECEDRPGGYKSDGTPYYLDGRCINRFCSWTEVETECLNDADCYAKMPAGYNQAECSYFKCFYWDSGDVKAPCPTDCCIGGSHWQEKKCTDPDQYCETFGGYVGHCMNKKQRQDNFWDVFAEFFRQIGMENISNAVESAGQGLGEFIVSILSLGLMALLIVVGGVVLMFIALIGALTYYLSRKR